jgi:uncharacterized Ntn-hydrolase superfamily protein
MTFSVVARDPTTGDLGVAVQSKFLAVGAAVIHASGGVGAIATQARANLSYGPRGLALLQAGATAALAVEALVGSDPLADRRQVGIVDASGRVAAHTGGGCSDWAGHLVGDGFSCQGNILVSRATLESMAATMSDRLDLPLPERLVAALSVGQAAGGDARGQESAGLLVVRPGGGYGGQSDRLMDLRIDDHPSPIAELDRLVALHRRYFDRPSENELVRIDRTLGAEIAERLARATGIAVDAEDPEALWTRLERWAGRENLEERMVRRGAIDQTVLGVLRELTDR